MEKENLTTGRKGLEKRGFHLKAHQAGKRARKG